MHGCIDSIKALNKMRAFLLSFCIVFSMILSGCAHNTQYHLPVNSLLEIRQQNVVTQQWDLSCGAAALATILTYQHGDAVPEKQIAESMLKRTGALKIKVKGGFSLLDLKRYVESRSFRGNGYLNLTLQNLTDFGPTIVPVNLGDYNHFVVFRGVVGDQVLLADPAFGNRTIDINTFKKSWLQNIGFVVSRRDGIAPPNRLTVQPSDFIRVSPNTVRQALR
jgi:uncharacterized protein